MPITSKPINSKKFEHGYTIEAFIKLPDPFEVGDQPRAGGGQPGCRCWIKVGS